MIDKIDGMQLPKTACDNLQNLGIKVNESNDMSIFNEAKITALSDDISQKSPLDLTLNADGKPCTILSQKIEEACAAKVPIVEDFCDSFNKLSQKLAMGKDSMPKIKSFSSKLMSKLKLLDGGMKSALKGNTSEILSSLGKCKTVAEIDEKIVLINAKLQASFDDFCAKIGVLNTMADLLTEINEVVTKAKNSIDNEEVSKAFDEIIDGIDFSIPDFSKAGSADQIKKQSQQSVQQFQTGDIAEKVRDFKQLLKDKISKQDEEDEDSQVKQTRTESSLKSKRPQE